MIELIWDEKFTKIYKKWAKKHPDLIGEFKERLILFSKDPFFPSLKTHALHGDLKGLWAIRITFQYRLIFCFFNLDKTKIILIDIGTHDEIY